MRHGLIRSTQIDGCRFPGSSSRSPFEKRWFGNWTFRSAFSLRVPNSIVSLPRLILILLEPVVRTWYRRQQRYFAVDQSWRRRVGHEFKLLDRSVVAISDGASIGLSASTMQGVATGLSERGVPIRRWRDRLRQRDCDRRDAWHDMRRRGGLSVCKHVLVGAGVVAKQQREIVWNRPARHAIHCRQNFTKGRRVRE